MRAFMLPHGINNNKIGKEHLYFINTKKVNKFPFVKEVYVISTYLFVGVVRETGASADVSRARVLNSLADC